MNSFISAAVLALFVVAASGAVIAMEARAEQPRPPAITHVYVCTDANFGGRCQNLDSIIAQCCMSASCYLPRPVSLFEKNYRWCLSLSFSQTDPLANGFNDAVSSPGPDYGTTCILYEYGFLFLALKSRSGSPPPHHNPQAGCPKEKLSFFLCFLATEIPCSSKHNQKTGISIASAPLSEASSTPGSSTWTIIAGTTAPALTDAFIRENLAKNDAFA